MVSRLDLWHQRAVELTLRKSMVKQVLQRSQRQDDFGWVSRAEKIMGTTNNHQRVRIQWDFFSGFRCKKGKLNYEWDFLNRITMKLVDFTLIGRDVRDE